MRSEARIAVPTPARRPFAVFRRFFVGLIVLDNALAMEPEAGLGLHLSRLVIDQFGGTVRCDSEEGHVATFGFALPVAEAV